MTEGDTRFVGEPIEPVAGTVDVDRMAVGEPGLPQRFVWRGEQHEVAAVLETGKRYGDCSHGSGERYLRAHTYRIRTKSGDEMKLSFVRRPRSASERRHRWWLQTIARRPDCGS